MPFFFPETYHSYEFIKLDENSNCQQERSFLVFFFFFFLCCVSSGSVVYFIARVCEIASLFASGCFLIVLRILLSQIPHSVTSVQPQ